MYKTRMAGESGKKETVFVKPSWEEKIALCHEWQEGIYLFYNRHHDKLKCLSWHKNGFILLYKRLEEGKFYVTVQPP